MGPRSALGPLVGLQREHLHRLAQAHVVGEARAEAEPRQERQPRDAPLLVGPQLRPERRRRLDRGDRLLDVAGEQLADPAVGVDRGDGQRNALLAVGLPVVGVAPRERHHLAGRERAAGPAAAGPAQELQPGAQPLGVDAHPLAPQPDQRRLRGDQLGDLLLGQLVVADRDGPAELRQLLAAQAAAGEHAVGGRAARAEREPDAARAVPPGGELHPEPGLDEQRRARGQELVGAVGLEVEVGGPGLAQRRGERRKHQGRPAQLGEQQLLRVGDQPLRAARPDLCGRHQQARVGAALEQELQHPAGAVAGLVEQVVAGVARVVQRADLRQPEARPRLPGRAGAERVPLGDGVGERRQLGGRDPLVAADAAVGRDERREPGLGGRKPSRRAAAARREQVDGAAARASRSRTAASVSAWSASATRSCGSGPGCAPRPGAAASARATGGSPATSASNVTASRPCTTGRHRANACAPWRTSVGRTRPRAASSAASAATARRCATEAP